MALSRRLARCACALAVFPSLFWFLTGCAESLDPAPAPTESSELRPHRESRSDSAAAPVPGLALVDDGSTWLEVPGLNLAAYAPHSPYANDEDHEWLIEAPACATAVRLVFDWIDIETDPYWWYDWVELRTAAGERIERIDGEHDDYVSAAVPGNAIELAFHSDYSVTRDGYAIAHVEAQGCSPCALTECGEGEMCEERAVQCLVAPCPVLAECVPGPGFCATVRCAAGTHCDEEARACVPDEEPELCICPRHYLPVCGEDGRTYGNACEAACTETPIAHEGVCGAVGDACGTIRGLGCSEPNACYYGDAAEGESGYDAPYPDAGGTCVEEGYCEAPTDCRDMVHIMCVGAWSCEDNACIYRCGPPVSEWRREALGISTPHPYRNRMVRRWSVAREGAVAMRLVFSELSVESGYDFVEIYDQDYELLAEYTGELGAFTTDDFAAEALHVYLVTDGSVRDYGFDLEAVEWR